MSVPEKIIPLFVTNLLDGLKVPLYGDGGNVRNWIHVDEPCRGIQLVIERGAPGRVYHINGEAELSNLELTRAILDQCGAGWDRVTPVPDRKGHDRRYSLDDRVLRTLGYAPRIPFADGLAATVRWYADHRAARTAVDDAEASEDAALRVNGAHLVGWLSAVRPRGPRWSRSPRTPCSTAGAASRIRRTGFRLGLPTQAGRWT